MTPASHNTVRLDTGPARYDISIGAGCLTGLHQTLASTTPGAKRAHLVIDTGVPEAMVDRVQRACAGLTCSQSRITPSEPIKAAKSWETLLLDIAEASLERSDLVIALGGGIIGDLAGFAAASYRRGIPIIQCPTTLLAMVDASVGGKTGFNIKTSHGLLKNMVGAFHQPAAVLADVDALASLDDRVFRSGLAECVKHAMLSADFGDPDLAGWMRRATSDILARDAQTLTELITRNVAVKAAVVRTDERERSTGDQGRALLNLGHTFAHAIETIEHLSPTADPHEAPLMHGEAVGLGLIASATLAEALGRAEDISEPMRSWLAGLGLPTGVRNLPETGEILSRMAHDKKAIGGRARFVIPVGDGSSRVVQSPAEQAVAAAIESIRA